MEPLGARATVWWILPSMGAIAFVTTAWGPAHGGINAFNTDLCEALARLTDVDLDVICVVLHATPEEIKRADERGVRLVPLEGECRDFVLAHAFQLSHLAQSWDDLRWWVGHDIISGPVAVLAAQLSGRPVGVIQHTDYPAYASFKGTSGERITARTLREIDILREATAVFGVGPKLTGTANNLLLSGSARATELVPGLASIGLVPEPQSNFNAITFGRLDPATDRVKLGKLAVTAFGQLIREAPEAVGEDPRITVFGIDGRNSAEENELKRIVDKSAGRAVAVIAHPFTESRETLHTTLGRSSVCMMLSVHEGFGLAGWEAIAAEVPLILTRNSGLYLLLKRYGGKALGCVKPVEIKGRAKAPYYRNEDLEAVTAALREVAIDQRFAKKNAKDLRRDLLSACTWEKTARTLLQALEISPAGGAVGEPLRSDTVELPASNLPGQRDTFIERAGQLDRGRRVLTDHQFLTLWGPAGIGKTRLALEIAAGLLASFDGHVYFVDLTTVAHPKLVINSISLALRIEADEPVIDALKALFRDRRALLVLDDFDDVRGGADAVAELVGAASQLRVIATSSKPLAIGSEHTIEVRALDTDASIRLFGDRSAEYAPAPSPTDAHLRRLCELVQGLPLAIELLAPRTRFYTTADLAEELDDSLGSTGQGGRLTQILRAAIGWSYQSLDEGQQRLVRSLSVFRGGCTLKTAAAMIGGRPDVYEKDMASLLDTGLLREVPEGSRRFQMVDTLRRYAKERLEDDAVEAESIRRQHASYFLRIAEHASQGSAPTAGQFKLELELGNLSTALSYFVDRHETESALRLALALGELWWSRDYLEGWRRLEEVLKLESADRPGTLYAKVLLARGRLGIRLGRLEEASKAFDVCLDIAEAGPDLQLKASGLADRALVKMETGDFDEAETDLQQALAIRQTDERNIRGIADVTDSLGVVAMGKGDYDAAMSYLRESRSLYKRVPDPIGEAWVCNDLACLALAQNDLKSAREHARAALLTGEKANDRGLIAWASNYLGHVASRTGAYQQARELHGRSLTLMMLLSTRRPTALALEGIAVLAAERQQWAKAVQLVESTFDVREQIPLTAAESARINRSLDNARARLPQAVKDAAIEAGRNMLLEEAVSFARAI